jgi:hypothetical protein
MNRILLYLFIILNTNILAQNLTNEQIERDLYQSYEKILSQSEANDINYDSLEFANEIFRGKMLYYTSFYPTTLTYSFDSLAKYRIEIASSVDQKFRIYSWNTRLGGTMYDFENIFQYKSNDKLYSIIINDTSEMDGPVYKPFYSEIYTITENNKSYYLAINYGIYSSKDMSETISVFTIENNSLLDSIKLFKTDKYLTNSITIEFDFFSVVNRPERPVKLVTYDEKKKIIYIPIINDKNQVTKCSYAYQFNGQYFEKKKRKYTHKN